jgi:hypothetical protein
MANRTWPLLISRMVASPLVMGSSESSVKMNMLVERSQLFLFYLFLRILGQLSRQQSNSLEQLQVAMSVAGRWLAATPCARS